MNQQTGFFWTGSGTVWGRGPASGSGWVHTSGGTVWGRKA